MVDLISRGPPIDQQAKFIRNLSTSKHVLAEARRVRFSVRSRTTFCLRLSLYHRLASLGHKDSLLVYGGPHEIRSSIIVFLWAHYTMLIFLKKYVFKLGNVCITYLYSCSMFYFFIFLMFIIFIVLFDTKKKMHIFDC